MTFNFNDIIDAFGGDTPLIKIYGSNDYLLWEKPSPIERVATPVISWYEPTFIITCATNGATIYYSYDNSTWNIYSGGVTLNTSATVYAKATKTGMNDSNIASMYCEIGGQSYNVTYSSEDVDRPLTFEIIDDGEIGWYWSRNTTGGNGVSLNYTKNGVSGVLQEAHTISVNAGDIITFVSNFYLPLSYWDFSPGIYHYFTSTGRFYAYGNIESVASYPGSGTNPDAYSNPSKYFPEGYKYKYKMLHAIGLFKDTLIDIHPNHNLIMCDDLFGDDGCCYEMFENCTLLTKTPIMMYNMIEQGSTDPIGATANAFNWEMFYGCSRLNTAYAFFNTASSRQNTFFRWLPERSDNSGILFHGQNLYGPINGWQAVNANITETT